MLCDVKYINHPVANIVAQARGSSADTTKVREGVYQIGHFSLNHMINPFYDIEEWPDLGEFNCFGVCDTYTQVIEQCPILETSSRQFTMSVTLIQKSEEPSQGGWRWHKWGPYIGTQEPTCEYLYNEPKIDRVYCFHIYENKRPNGKLFIEKLR